MSALLAPPYDVEAEVRRTLPGQWRHLGRLRRSARDLWRFTRQDEASLRASLRPRFAALGAALLQSPYYVERLRQDGLSTRDLRGPDDLPAFPLLDRATLRDEQERIASLPPRRTRPRGGEGAPAGELLLDRTTGSTGTPLRVLKDGYDTLHVWAVLRYLTRALGVKAPRRPRVALLCALPHGVEYAVDPPALQGGRLRRISLARPEPLRRLLDFDPDVLFSDPAGLHWLLAQEERPRPRIALSSGQHLPAALRAEASARLLAPVVNYYSTTETGPVAFECLHRPCRFHVLHPDVWVESREGELIVTRLRPSVLPLLRYRTGDAGEVEAEECPCGYRGRSIVGFLGRRACAFETPEGRRVDAWRLAWLFKHEPLSAFRLTQVEPSGFRLELGGASDGEALRRRLEEALRRLGWPSPRIEILAADELAQGQAKPEPFRRASGALGSQVAR